MMKMVAKAIYRDDDLSSINTDLVRIHSWLQGQSLRLNLTKVKFVVVYRRTSPLQPTISLDGHLIEQVYSFKLLVVLVDPALFWQSHI